jgi:penicillin-binding protein 2
LEISLILGSLDLVLNYQFMLTKNLSPIKNKTYFFFLTLIITAVLMYNLINLQIVQGSKYYFESKNSFAVFSVVRANRGIIYDRNGVKLVENQPKYNLYVFIDESRPELREKTLENLSKIFNEDIKSKYEKEFERVKDFKNVSEVKLFSNLDYNPYVYQIEANLKNFPLLKVDQVFVRKYLYPEETSHILGYTGDIAKEDYDTGKYNYGDVIGKFGIEQGYDDILRGNNGIERIDYYGSEDRKVSTPVQPKVNGKDLYLTIDINHQKKLYETIKTTLEREDLKQALSTSAVVEDVNNGEILAMASYPNFDANLFVQGIKQEDYDKYIQNPGKPLTNKALQYAQPSGSIFKPLTDMVLLNEGAIDKSTILAATGTFNYGGVPFSDFAGITYGDLNVVQGLCYSSNIFHMKGALRLDEKTNGKAADLIAKTFSDIGLDKKSNLKIGSEALGYFPTPKDKEAKGEIWYPGYLLNAVIGQGEVKMSPLGATKLASTLASKGKVKDQTIILDKDRTVETKDLGISSQTFDIINEGMVCSARRNNGAKYDLTKYPEVSEKTGTAETGQYLKGKELIHSWEITYTPAQKPEIAMAVFVENGGFGFRSGIISREFYKYWNDSKGK